MIEGLAALVVGMIVFAVVGLCVGLLSFVLWLVFLPFRLFGLLLKGLGFLLALPFMLLFGAVGVLVFGFGAMLFLLPLAPFALLAFLLWRWVRGRPRATVSA